MTVDQKPMDEHIINFGKKAKEAFENRENWHSCSPDIPPCCVCKKLIHDFPFRLFNWIFISNAQELNILRRRRRIEILDLFSVNSVYNSMNVI